jgi:RHS repeat-associated protein
MEGQQDMEWLLNKQYVWGIRYIDELILRDNDTTNSPNGTLNTRHYALQDANFNVVAIIGSTGSVVRRYSYDAYGHSTTLNADFTPGAYEYDFEYRYAGYRWDYETQLLQVRNRWYHPRLGRWVSRDPAGYGDGMSLYAYATSRPTTGSDPMGLTYEQDGEKLQYTCNCGWIDWGHANPDTLKGIWELVTTRKTNHIPHWKLMGPPSYMRIVPDYIPNNPFFIQIDKHVDYGFPVGSIGAKKNYILDKNMPESMEKPVAMAIWRDIAYQFELAQGTDIALNMAQQALSWWWGPQSSSP